DDLGEFFALRDGEFECATENLAAFARWGGSPGILRGGSSVEGRSPVGDRCARDRRDDVAGGGVQPIEGCAVFGVTPLTADEESGWGVCWKGCHDAISSTVRRFRRSSVCRRSS